MHTFGSYRGPVGEVFEDELGNTYRWAEGVDGLGNPVGFWKQIRSATSHGVHCGPGCAAHLNDHSESDGDDAMTMHANQDEPLGIGGYVGERRVGPDGRLFEWVEGVDGLGNPIGFWKAVGDVVATAGKAVGRGVVRTGKAIGDAAGSVVRGASDVAHKAVGTVADLLDPVKKLFDLVVRTNIHVAQRVPIPQHFRRQLHGYARAHPPDAALVMQAIRRSPRFYRGGWILKLQPKAGAMTLGRHIFVRPDVSITPGLYAHELAHVAQFACLGVTGFLASYYGASALTVLRRWIQRKPVNEMKSSPHEARAYGVEQRFVNWCAANPSQCEPAGV